jgi:thymidine kinase
MAPFIAETGPMFSEKSKNMLTAIDKRVRRGQKQGTDFLVFTHKGDNRYGNGVVASNDSRAGQHDAIALSSSNKLLAYLFDADPDGNITGIKTELRNLKAIYLDEAQFFRTRLPEALDYIYRSFVTLHGREEDFTLHVAGLDTDAFGNPFRPMSDVLALATDVIKNRSICPVSGLDATRSQRLINGKPVLWGSPVILVGSTDSYEPRAITSHEVPGKPAPKITIYKRKSSG